MRPFILLPTILVVSSLAYAGGPRAVDLRCEYAQDPLAVQTAVPRLGWKLESGVSGDRQTAYRILVASSEVRLADDEGDLWDSGKVDSDETLHIEYAGRPLASAQRCYWKVRVWDRDAKPSDWSDAAQWTVGLLGLEDWHAKWITASTRIPPGIVEESLGRWLWHEKQPEGTSKSRVFFRQKIVLPPGTRSVTIAVSADDRYRLSYDGKPIGEDDNWRNLECHTIETPPHLAPGTHVVAVEATNEGPDPRGMLCAIVVEDARGGRKVLPDEGWRCAITPSNGWNAADFDDSEWVEPFQMGVYPCEPWNGLAIARRGRLPLVRKTVRIDKPLHRATVHLCGLGQHELSLNGEKIGDHFMAPGWTNYRKTCLYETFDVTDRLLPGENVFGVMLGNGMYNVEGGRYVKFTGSFGPPKLIARIRLEYEDGTVEHIGTDETWQTAEGPITFSCIFGGEDFDARLVQPGWNASGFDAAAWRGATVADGPGGRLVAQVLPPIRQVQTHKPKEWKEVKPGVWMADLGQNCSGIPFLRVSGPAGAMVRITPSELLLADGTVDQRHSGGPHYYEYALCGEGIETFTPRFTYYGFRYLQLEGAVPEGKTADNGIPVVHALEGRFTRCSAPRVGRFRCSNELMNRIHDLVDWSVGSNLQSVLTDCPHREKLGWLEVAHLMGPSILYTYDTASFYEKVAADTTGSQCADGLVPDIAPEYTVFSGGFRDSPEWGSASVQIPKLLFEWYGDRRILEAQYETMRRYVDYLESKSDGHVVKHGLNDWCDYIHGGSVGVSQLTPFGITGTVVQYQNLRFLAETARLLGKEEDAKKYAALAEATVEAFERAFRDADSGRIGSGSQASYAMPLAVGLLRPEHREKAAALLLEELTSRDYVTTGEIAFPYLIRTLADMRRDDLFYRFMNRTTPPGYGHQLNIDATSLTEAWDGRLGVSHNHCMLGHIVEWFYAHLVGIRNAPGSLGFKRIIIDPRPVGDIAWAEAEYNSIRGPITVRWDRPEAENAPNRMTLRMTIPPNTTADVFLPAARRILHDGKPVEDAKRTADGRVAVSVESGDHVFAVEPPPE